MPYITLTKGDSTKTVESIWLEELQEQGWEVVKDGEEVRKEALQERGQKEVNDMSLEELRACAIKLGIRFSPNAGLPRLIEQINAVKTNGNG